MVCQGYALLNCDDHKSFLSRNGKDPSEYRPDICHQVTTRSVSSTAWHHTVQHCRQAGFAHIGSLLLADYDWLHRLF